MQRAILGLIKGSIVGGGIAYGIVKLGFTGTAWVYLACATVGALVGVVCGRAPWKSETIWTPVVKLVFGALVGAGLCALGRNFVPGFHLATVEHFDVTANSAPFLATAVGILYGLFVEIDDGGKTDEKALPANKKKSLPAAE